MYFHTNLVSPKYVLFFTKQLFTIPMYVRTTVIVYNYVLNIADGTDEQTDRQTYPCQTAGDAMKNGSNSMHLTGFW